MKEYGVYFAGKLTAKRVNNRLEWKIQLQEKSVKIQAEYFGTALEIVFEVSTADKSLSSILKIGDAIILEMERNRQSLKYINQVALKVIKAMNSYVHTRRFCIQKIGRGRYRLLDPNGFDYIGEYVTLKDARKTCCGNYYYIG